MPQNSSENGRPVLQLVVGQHRSGTSVSTQLLSILNLDMGRTQMLPSFDNPRGFWENSLIVAAHDKLLKALDHDWTTAAGMPERWADTDAADAAVEEISNILKTDFDAGKDKLVKDPRLCVLLPIWPRIAAATGHDLHVMGVLRHPEAVGASIGKRNQLDTETVAKIVGSQFASLRDNLSDDVPVLIYENLIPLSGVEILEKFAQFLPHLDVDKSGNMANLVNRIVADRKVSKSTGDTSPYAAFLARNAGALFADDASMKNFFDAAADDAARKALSGTQTLLPKSTKSVTINAARLAELKQAETTHIELEAAYARLEKEFKDKASDLQAYSSKVGTVNHELVAKNDALNSLKGGIEERDHIIETLREQSNNQETQTAAFHTQIEALTQQIAELDAKDATHLSKYAELQQVLAVLEQDKSALSEARNRLSDELSTKAQEANSIKSQRDGLNLELRQLKSEQDVLAEQKHALVRELDSQKKALSTVEAKLNSTLDKLEEAVATHKALKTERDTLQGDIEHLKKDAARLSRNLKSTKTRLNNKVTERDDELSFLKSSITDIKTNLIETRASEATFRKAADERLGLLQNAHGELFETRETLKNTSDALTETNRLKEMQEVTIEMEGVRAKMVEDQFDAKVKQLENRIKYFEAAPLRVGLKSTVFRVLRGIRRTLPLPESMKLKMAQKMTPLALNLQPPATVINHQQTALSNDMTIDFSFKETDNPVISIVVPVYNEISQTIACLKSIYQQRVSVDYEVILADDASPDPFASVLKEIKGLRYFRNETNQHFLRNCNRNAAHSRGDYIVFLNNDTIVKPGWLQNLFMTFLDHGDVGIVGSKLVYPTGELQEAGGILWEDASGWNWGKGQDPAHPLYNFVRDVDFVSGASLMITTELWRETGGFNEGLEKAYYEDADLCFQVRKMGKRVLYQPSSVVIHIEGLTSGTDLTQGAKQYQVINEGRFKEFWKEELKTHLPNAQTPHIASDRNVRGHVLYVDSVTPEPDKDAGSVNAYYSMRLLIEQGYRVHFIPGSNFAHWGEATSELQRIGVECVYHPFYSNMDQYLSERGDVFDHVILSRAESTQAFTGVVRKYCPSASIIYNTVDLHYLRMEREAEVKGDADMVAAAKAMKVKELDFMRDTDGTIVLSEVEHKMLAEENPDLAEKLYTLPLIRPKAHRLVEFDTTSDIVFLGGYKHPPNVDAVEWLVSDIWPKVRKAVPGARLKICGSHMPEHFKTYAADDIIIKGFVPDLDELLSETRLTIAPLRYGAGLKGKVASSIGAGVPCVGTGVAFEGMAEDKLDTVKLLATTPKEFVAQIKSIYDKRDRWEEVSHAGVVYHNENYDYQHVAKDFAAMLSDLA